MDVSNSILFVLPDILWYRIACSSLITAEDLCRLKSVSLQLYRICSQPEIWRDKFFTRWPTMSRYDDELNHAELFWSVVYTKRYLIARSTCVALRELSKRFCYHDEVEFLPYLAFYEFDVNISQLTDNEKLINSNLITNMHIDELRLIVNDKSLDRNMTNRYYAERVLAYLVRESLSHVWNAHQSLEVGACVIASWLEPNVECNVTEVLEFCDKMAENVIELMKFRYPTHPILVDDEWKERMISVDNLLLSESLWLPDDVTLIISALNIIFTVRYGFLGNTDDYYNLDNSLLNKVIHSRKGLPITLSILYHAVARRLGVKVLPVGCPSHFVLKYLSHPNLSDANKFTFIDPFHECRLLNENDLWQRAQGAHGGHILRDPSFFNPVSNEAVWSRMLSNIFSVEHRSSSVTQVLTCAALELSVIVSPNNLEKKVLLARAYMHMEINPERVLALMASVPSYSNDINLTRQRRHFEDAARQLQEIQHEMLESEIVVPPIKNRLDSSMQHVKFAVGQIMRHREYDYTCVVRGWDPKCEASSSWIRQMNVFQLTRQDRQPFYHVLVNDGSSRYAAEDNLIFEPNPVTIAHSDVGRYFTEYCGTYYKMNEQLKLIYCNDEEACLVSVNNVYSANI